MNRISEKIVIGFLIGFVALQVQSESPEEGVFLDPRTGDYRVRFLSDPDNSTTLVEEVFYPHTKIVPIVNSKLDTLNDGLIEYRYKVRNSEASKQNIITLILYVSSANSAGQIFPPKWSGSVTPNIGGVGDIVGWGSRMYKYEIGVVTNLNDSRWKEPALLGIAPGSVPVEFGFRSRDLPGIEIIRLRGAAAITTFSVEGPDPTSPVGKTYHELRQRDFVPRFVAAPRIPVPAPFDAATVLAHIQKHLVDDLVPMKLVDPAFADRFHRLLDAAIDAAKRGNTAGLRAHLKDLRLVLKGFGEPGEANHAAKKDDDLPDDQINTKHWPHPVAKLAAQVLDFDLNYVEKKLK